MIIPYTDAYKSFVMSCWTRGLLDSQRWPRERSLALDAVRALVLQLMDKCNVAVMIGDDPAHALGCVAWEGRVLYLLYVKRPMRGMGRGSELLDYAGRPTRSYATTHSWPHREIRYR